MANITEGQSSSKRALVTDVNLVPFIDLLSVCICFLLITAVWVHLGILEVKQSQGTSASVQKGGFEMAVTLVNPETVRMELRQNNRVRRKKTVVGKSLDQLQGSVAKVAQKFRSFSKSKLTTALLTPNQSVDYGHLVAIMDTLRRNEITNLGVVATGKGVVR
ncbi:MAG: biopolymer transporter ExbD [Bacteriovoracales bacterium]|nr:biopolymer transporter ExbD [Bacteriovoracales bacterium]